MKSRNGFVSNSSSSSFVIIAKDDKPKGYFNIIDILKLTYNHAHSIKSITGNELIYTETKTANSKDAVKVSTIKEFLQEDKWTGQFDIDDINRLKCQIKGLENILKQSDEIILSFNSQGNRYKKDMTIEFAKEELSNDLQNKSKQLAEKEKELLRKKNIIKIAKKYQKKNGDYVILDFTVDHFDTGNILEYIKRAKAKVLEMITT